MRHSSTLLAIFLFVSNEALAAPIDPGGVVGGILGFVLFVPLLILLVVGGALGGIKGAAIGAAVYALGLAILFLNGAAEDREIKKEFATEQAAFRNACLFEAGEFGKPIEFPINKVLVTLDQRAAKFWLPLKFNESDVSAIVSYISSPPTEVAADEVLVSINLINKSIEGAGTRRLQGFETTVADHEKSVLAKRTNFAKVSDACFPEDEVQAIDRFLSRIIGVEVGLSNRLQDASGKVAREYPVAKVTSWESGNFETNEAHSAKMKELIPREWGCVFVRNVGGAEIIQCPNSRGEMKNDSGLQNAMGLRNLKDSWILVDRPHMWFSDRLKVEERYRDGSIKRILHVRFPHVEAGNSWAVGDVRNTSDGLEIDWLDGLAADNRYKRRLRMTIPSPSIESRQELH